jgi:hypothetical protein
LAWFGPHAEVRLIDYLALYTLGGTEAAIRVALVRRGRCADPDATLDEAYAESGHGLDLSRAVDLHRQVRRALAAVVAVSRLATLAWSR